MTTNLERYEVMRKVVRGYAVRRWARVPERVEGTVDAFAQLYEDEGGCNFFDAAMEFGRRFLPDEDAAGDFAEKARELVWEIWGRRVPELNEAPEVDEFD